MNPRAPLRNGHWASCCNSRAKVTCKANCLPLPFIRNPEDTVGPLLVTKSVPPYKLAAALMVGYAVIVYLDHSDGCLA